MGMNSPAQLVLGGRAWERRHAGLTVTVGSNQESAGQAEFRRSVRLLSGRREAAFQPLLRVDGWRTDRQREQLTQALHEGSPST